MLKNGGSLPVPPNRWFLEAFKYPKTTRNHLLGGTGTKKSFIFDSNGQSEAVQILHLGGPLTSARHNGLAKVDGLLAVKMAGSKRTPTGDHRWFFFFFFFTFFLLTIGKTLENHRFCYFLFYFFLLKIGKTLENHRFCFFLPLKTTGFGIFWSIVSFNNRDF